MAMEISTGFIVICFASRLTSQSTEECNKEKIQLKLTLAVNGINYKMKKKMVMNGKLVFAVT